MNKKNIALLFLVSLVAIGCGKNFDADTKTNADDKQTGKQPPAEIATTSPQHNTAAPADNSATASLDDIKVAINNLQDNSRHNKEKF
jgi:hypothetical protein